MPKKSVGSQTREAANPHGCAIPEFPVSVSDIDRLFGLFPVKSRLQRQRTLSE
jgi:hypothetical protein